MGNKLHAGFPEAALDKYAQRMVSKGFTVGIVEQVETSQEFKARKKDKGCKEIWEKCQKRELIKVLTKGTYCNHNTIGYQPRYLISIYTTLKVLNFTIVDITLGCIICGSFDSDIETKLSSLFFKYPPTEIIYDPSTINNNILRLITNTQWDPQVNRYNDNRGKVWTNPSILTSVLEILEKDKLINTKLGYETMINQMGEDNSKQSLYGMLSYLNKLKILESTIQSCLFSFYSEFETNKLHMVIDSQTLENLEILESKTTKIESHSTSLYENLNKVTGSAGKRMLRDWLASPLMNIETINERLDSIEFLSLTENRGFINKFKDRIKLLGDYQRKLIRMYSYGVRLTSETGKVVMFQDISTKRLLELKDLLSELEKSVKFFKNTKKEFNKLNDSKANRILRLITPVDETMPNGEYGLLQNFEEVISEVNRHINWNGGIPEPTKGINPDFDSIEEKINNVENSLAQELRRVMDDNNIARGDIRFFHGKTRYAIEVPTNTFKGKSIPKGYQFDSRVKGMSRYTTDKTKELVIELEDFESQKKDILVGFCTFIFEYIASERGLFDSVASILSEIDVLICLKDISFGTPVNMCRPHIVNRKPGQKSYSKFKDSTLFQLALHNSSFVPNDINMGGEDPSLLLLTGANMGGKSTIMRQVSINTILGQIGCYVAAEEAEFTLVDRIFTRIGANDKLELGKSTFFVEMEDMHLMSQYGTDDSLCIVDELGRGTDAIEGTAIASSFMEMLSKMSCRCIFATHFHMLFRFAREDPNIDYYKMKVYLDEFGDISFLYKLERGVTESSFGVKVAKIAGIKQDILTNAENMSLKFDKGMIGVFQETNTLWKNICSEFDIVVTGA